MLGTLPLQRLLTDKTNLGKTRLEERHEDAGVAPGEILLKIDLFAITTNNITYAAFGDAMNYWEFFPTGQPVWGHMPVWGFADVVTSAAPGVEVGERFYGYFPIASHFRMKTGRVTSRGFYDEAPHRQPLPSAYNQYTRCAQDSAYEPDLERHQALFRPLFITSYMLADFLSDHHFFGATRLVISSASSKTAYGTAFCLQEADIERIALTSARNRAFVHDLGCYSAVVEYGAVSTLPVDAKVLYVDFSGDDALRATIHRHFGVNLVYDCYAGSTQNSEFLKQTDLPGPAPQFYFAPVQIRKRNADWGPQEVTRRFNASQLAFFRRVSSPTQPWIEMVESRGIATAQPVIADLFAGQANPRQGHIVRL